jgi:hypothetical protein
MMAAVAKILLMASGCLFWIVVGIAIWLETRSRRYLTGHREEWPEPIFRRMVTQPAEIQVLCATLRRDAARLAEAVVACRRGTGVLAIEDMFIRDEINEVLASSGLMVVDKG